MFFKSILSPFKANKIDPGFVLNFSQDWCGSSYRQHHLGESGSVTILNSDLYWHGKTSLLDQSSVNAGKNTSPLIFKDEAEVLNYLFSLKFLTSLTNRNSYTSDKRTIWGLHVSKADNFTNFDPFGGETVYEFVSRVSNKECLEMLELNLKEFLGVQNLNSIRSL